MDPNYPTPLYTNPADYFAGDAAKAEGTLTKASIYGFSGGVAYVMSAYYNYLSYRPILSGIQRHVIAVSIGLLVGHLVYKERNYRHAVRDAMYKHYIELHPEDFPPIERQKYRDIFEPWLPIR